MTRSTSPRGVTAERRQGPDPRDSVRIAREASSGCDPAERRGVGARLEADLVGSARPLIVTGYASIERHGGPEVDVERLASWWLQLTRPEWVEHLGRPRIPRPARLKHLRQRVARRLQRRDIHIKPLEDPVLGHGYMRVTTGLPEDNRRLLAALEEILDEMSVGPNLPSHGPIRTL